MEKLEIRLFSATRVLRYFLFLIGLPDNRPGKWNWFKKFWKLFCYLAAVQAHAYIFFQRSYRYFDLNFIVSLDGFLAIFDRLNRFLGNLFLQTFLVLKLEGIFITLCHRLEGIDAHLNRPDLSHLKLLSAIAVVWIFILGNAITTCAMYWELVEQKLRPIHWINCVDQFIRVETQMFCSAGAIAFAIFGQLLVIFYKAASAVSPSRTISELLRIHYQLAIVANHLKNCFTPILLVNCVHIFIGFIFNAYAFVNEIRDPEWLSLTIWDGLLCVGCFVRLWLICSTADSIRQSAVDSVEMLRNLRNYKQCARSTNKRHQITLAIVEIYRIQPNFNILGLFTLTRHMILQVFESALTILVVLNQYKAKGRSVEFKENRQSD